MWMKEKRTDDLIRITEPEQLLSPFEGQVRGRRQSGEEEQPEQEFDKSQLVFPSGEAVPACWTDPSYQAGSR